MGETPMSRETAFFNWLLGRGLMQYEDRHG